MALKNRFWAFIIAFVAFSHAMAETLTLQPNAPERYVVAKGDTLWDISAKFLRDPWLWPEIWQVNPNIANPHLIYPGDTVVLTYDANGQPHLTLQRGDSTAGATIKLSPTARSQPVDTAIPPIPLDVIQQFLKKAGVITKAEYDRLPYIVSFQDDRLAAGTNDMAYVRGISDASRTKFAVIHLGQAYQNPGAKAGDILGYETIEAATVGLERTGDPATVRVTSVERELLKGDRVMPQSDEPLKTFVPHPAPDSVEGSILAVIDGISRIGQHQVVALNVGTAQGIEPGHVFAVYQAGRKVHDEFSKKRGGDDVTLPDERAGLVIVFRTFEKISYALVTRSDRDMRILDKVKKP